MQHKNFTINIENYKNDSDDDGTDIELPESIRRLSKELSQKLDQNESEAIQEGDEYYIDPKNLKKLYVLGQGTFGEAAVYLDEQTTIKYARKLFNSAEEYKNEKLLIQQIQQRVGKKFSKIGAALEKFDNKNKMLYYQCGECSLEDFMKVRGANKVWWWERQQELIFILQELFNFFKILFEYEIYHTDLKPANVILEKKVDSNMRINYVVKLIDFGSIVFDYRIIKSLTREYYIPDYEYKIPFASKQDRIKAEYYSLGRTMQRIMISSVSYSEKILIEQLFDSSDKSVHDCFEKLEEYYDPALLDIVKMLIKQENSDVIEQKIKELFGEPIKDPEDLVDQILIEKQHKNLDEINEENVVDEIKYCLNNHLHSRSKQIFEKLGEKLDYNIDLVLLKIRVLARVGNYDEMQTYIKNVWNSRYKFPWNEAQDKTLKLKQLKLHLYFKYTFHQPTRYSGMEQIRAEIVELAGEESEDIAYFEFFNGWLCLADKESGKHFLEKSLKHLNLSAERYIKALGDELHQEVAEVYRYLGQVYYNLKDADKSIEVYQKEYDIRVKIESALSPEIGNVLNSLASCYGHLKNDVEKGLKMILEVLDLYQSTIGQLHQQYCIGLQWKGWYLNRLKKREEALDCHELSALLSYQVYGKHQTLYKQTVTTQIIPIYLWGSDGADRINQGFIVPMEREIKLENFKKAFIYYEVGYFIFEEYMRVLPQYPSNHEKQKQTLNKLKWKFELRAKYFSIRQEQQTQINLINQIESLKNIVDNLPDQCIMERIDNEMKRLGLIVQLDKNQFWYMIEELDEQIEYMKDCFEKGTFNKGLEAMNDELKDDFRNAIFLMLNFKANHFKDHLTSQFSKNDRITDEEIQLSMQTEECFEALKRFAFTDKQIKFSHNQANQLFLTKVSFYLLRNMISQAERAIEKQIDNCIQIFGKSSIETFKFVQKVADLLYQKKQFYQSKKFYKLLLSMFDQFNYKVALDSNSILVNYCKNQIKLIHETQKNILKANVQQQKKKKIVQPSDLLKADTIIITQSEQQFQKQQQQLKYPNPDGAKSLEVIIDFQPEHLKNFDVKLYMTKQLSNSNLSSPAYQSSKINSKNTLNNVSRPDQSL